MMLCADVCCCVLLCDDVLFGVVRCRWVLSCGSGGYLVVVVCP